MADSGPLTQAQALSLLQRTTDEGWLAAELSGPDGTAVLNARTAIAAATSQTEAQFRAQAEAAVPVKRFFQPEEIAHGIAWLLDPANTMQVGQCLNLDGGVVQV